MSRHLKMGSRGGGGGVHASRHLLSMRTKKKGTKYAPVPSLYDLCDSVRISSELNECLYLPYDFVRRSLNLVCCRPITVNDP